MPDMMVRQGTAWAVKRMGNPGAGSRRKRSAHAGHIRWAKAWARRGSSAQPAMNSTVNWVPTASISARR